MFRALTALPKSRPSLSIPSSVGSLVERNIPPEWSISPVELSVDHLATKPQKLSSPIFPESLSGWIKVMDRDAGDDEKDYARIGSAAVVADTKLAKYEILGTGRFQAVKTASPDCMIEILNDMQNSSSPNVAILNQVISRIEYLSTTLSVKKIRLLLEALGNVTIIGIDPQAVHVMVRAVGNELLCRFHALTLNSCASILTSLAKLKCVEPGTLNILGIGFERLCNESRLDDRRMVEHSLSVMKAYKDLEYPVEGVTDMGLKVIGERVRDLNRDDFFGVIDLVGFKNEIVSKHDWIVLELPNRVIEATAAQLMTCAELCGKGTTSTQVREIVRDNLISRLQVRSGSLTLLDEEREDEDGLPVRTFSKVNPNQIQTVKNFLGETHPLLDQLDSTVSQ